MPAKIELIYDHDCPNIEPARAQLLAAFAQLGRTPHWLEWDRGNPGTPDYVRAFGSPTILVDGKDVGSGARAVAASSCRVYETSDGRLSGVPAVANIVAAMSDAPAPPAPPARWRRIAAAAPALLLAFLPKLTCPACWPAYTALLGAIGINFVNYTPYLLPASVFFSGVALLPVYTRARLQRSYRLLAWGLFGAAVMLIGKFAYDSDHATYVGAAILFFAVLRNAWQSRTRACDNCAAA